MAWDPRETRVRPAEPAQGASDGLAATQTIYTALEPAKDLRRTRVDPRAVSHTTQVTTHAHDSRLWATSLPDGMDPRGREGRVITRVTHDASYHARPRLSTLGPGPHRFLMEWTREAARAVTCAGPAGTAQEPRGPTPVMASLPCLPARDPREPTPNTTQKNKTLII